MRDDDSWHHATQFARRQGGTLDNTVDNPARRRLVILAGARHWAQSLVARQLPADAADDLLWIADSAPDGLTALPASQVATRLGSECGLLVFDAHAGFHPDAFAAAAGTLRGGGDCLLLTPPLGEWQRFDDPDRQRFAAWPHTTGAMRGLFLDRLQRLWSGQAGVRVVTAGDDIALRVATRPAAGPVRLNHAQEAVVAAVERVARGHARRPLVLTADRGRGKSTALGVAAARLLQQHGVARISVIAPQRAAVATLYRQACSAAGLDAPRGVVARIAIGQGQLHFRVPAEWQAADATSSALVLVDEAAAIPVAWLDRLLQGCNRIVFASTVHGYEGSGRGFDLRFRRVLDRRMPQWHALRLEEPVRWAADDPLERALNRALLLDVDLAGDDRTQPLDVDLLDAAQLAADEPLLRAVFALLINAHYQTRPADLRQLLDNPDVRLWVARSGARVSGVLLCVAEGGFDAATAEQVLVGRRRPRGHLLAQSLAVHAGLDDALRQRTLRVQRIAVHPDQRRSGIGRRLLQAARVWATQTGFDLLGCVYGVDAALLAFWHANGFRAVRLGVRVDPASATHSLFMLLPLSADGDTLAAHAHAAFQRDLPWALGAALCAFDSRVAATLLDGRDLSDLALTTTERTALSRIADGARRPGTAVGALWKAAVHAAAAVSGRPERTALLLAVQLQHHAVDEVCAAFDLSGRAALDAQLRAAVRDLLMTRAEHG